MPLPQIRDGDNTSPQPYVHGTSLAQQVIDMLRASRDLIGGTVGNSSSPCLWNSQLFLMGYSEGGYVTMMTTRELQLYHYKEFTVTASAPLSGPHDLSGEMRTLKLSSNTSKAPYFLPFLLTGYNYVYGRQTSIFTPLSAMVSPFNTILPPKFDGNTPSDQISEAMGMSFSPDVKLIVQTSPTTTFTPSRHDTDRWFTSQAERLVPCLPEQQFHLETDRTDTDVPPQK
jgi:hypothetical protein